MGDEVKLDGCDIFLLIISIFLPPLGVLLEIGCHIHFWINLLLSLLFYIPGLIHAFWIILLKPVGVNRPIVVKT